MATHSSILARKIPWTEEPGGLWSMGSQRATWDHKEPDVTEVNEHTCMHYAYFLFCFSSVCVCVCVCVHACMCASCHPCTNSGTVRTPIDIDI